MTPVIVFAINRSEENPEYNDLVARLFLRFLRDTNGISSQGQGIFDMAFAVTRVWLHVSSEFYTMPRLHDPHRSDSVEEVTSAMLDLKAGHINSRRCRHAHGYDPTCSNRQVTLFEEEYFLLDEEADHIQRILDNRNSQRSLKAASLYYSASMGFWALDGSH